MRNYNLFKEFKKILKMQIYVTHTCNTSCRLIVIYKFKSFLHRSERRNGLKTQNTIKGLSNTLFKTVSDCRRQKRFFFKVLQKECHSIVTSNENFH